MRLSLGLILPLVACTPGIVLDTTSFETEETALTGDTASDDTGWPTGDTGAPEPPWMGVPFDRPLRLLFLGNSFTHQGPVPTLVRDVAVSVGWPAPDVAYVAPGGQSLSFHRTNPDSLDAVDEGEWDAVVLQDFSTRPTDDAGDPDGFKADATWFYDRIKARSPEALVVLYETWARHPDHGIYPDTFSDPLAMQAQLRTHYHDAAMVSIPTNATFEPSDEVVVAPVGDAWESHLAESDALMLHGPDLYHAGTAGRVLNAYVLYSTIYDVVVSGAGSLQLTENEAARLQASADVTTGIVQEPPPFESPTFPVGRTIELDLGTLPTPGTNVLEDCTAGSATLVDTTGTATGVSVAIIQSFTGSNEAGLPDNLLGWPETVSRDVCWVGSFDGHDAARLETATVALRGLDTGTYDLTLFASRSGDDGGIGRLTRYTVDGVSTDLEVSDNVADTVTLEVSPDASGTIALDVAVSPDGAARFGYLGALVLTRSQ
ncbi:MAG: hypothetical protein AAF211_08675 [Myxococcota bacterium]